ncbi:YlcI/YnfO family protein [Rothia nasimurium]|uniref:Prevent-host-death protein n=1 Tax=Luteibacter anthropi TaxID=564369 RepID=A0A7X5ZGV1_9GAMM|nr:YlcI/YnfO family protein [Luteibacter anthropi]NII05089.1 prevent-host-death protein [Luteibacter anthropi]
MKTATIPSIRVEPAFREQAEDVLVAGETLSSFVETALAEAIDRRRMQRDFIARGLASRDDAARTGVYHAAADVHKEIAERLGDLPKGKR